MIENFGAAVACLGAVFNCSPTRKIKRVGFGLWVISNSALWIWCATIQAWGPLAMYTVFLGTSTWGFVNHNDTSTYK